jgi:hypothetical protein
MKTFSAILCAGLLLAAPVLAATPDAKAPAAKAAPAKAPVAKTMATKGKAVPGDLKSGGATWNISAADSMNPALVVNLVTPAPKGPAPGDAAALTAAKLYLKGQKAMKGCAVSGAPQPVIWGDNAVWVVSLACK